MHDINASYLIITELVYILSEFLPISFIWYSDKQLHVSAIFESINNLR